jgi:TonB family protein
MKIWNFIILICCIIFSCGNSFALQNNDSIQYPEYFGGVRQFQEDVFTYFKYPEKAKKQKIQGIVNVEFFIDTNSTIVDLKIIEGINREMDSCAIEIVKLLNNWKPGKINGVVSKMKVQLPIELSIYNENFFNYQVSEAQERILKFRRELSIYLLTGNLDSVCTTLKSINDLVTSRFNNILNPYNFLLINLIAENYSGTIDLMLTQRDLNRFNGYFDYDLDVKRALDIYMENNHQKIAKHLYNSNIEKKQKDVLILFWQNDSLYRFPEDKNVVYKEFQGLVDVTLVNKYDKLGTNYLRNSTDTLFHSFVRKNILKEKYYKSFSFSMLMGGSNMFLKRNLRDIYSNPKFFSVDFNLYYKRFCFVLDVNLGSIKNRIPISIDTVNFNSNSKLEINYQRYGLGYRFFLTDLIHFVPNIAFSNLFLSYSDSDANKNSKSKTINKDIMEGLSYGFTINFLFKKSTIGNYKPARFDPFGICFKYTLQPDGYTNLSGINHVFGLSISASLMYPKREAHHYKFL